MLGGAEAKVTDHRKPIWHPFLWLYQSINTCHQSIIPQFSRSPLWSDGDHRRYKTREHICIHTFNFYFSHRQIILIILFRLREILEVFVSYKYDAHIFESQNPRFSEPSKVAKRAKCDIFLGSQLHFAL